MSIAIVHRHRISHRDGLWETKDCSDSSDLAQSRTKSVNVSGPEDDPFDISSNIRKNIQTNEANSKVTTSVDLSVSLSDGMYVSLSVSLSM